MQTIYKKLMLKRFATNCIKPTIMVVTTYVVGGGEENRVNTRKINNYLLVPLLVPKFLVIFSSLDAILRCEGREEKGYVIT